MNHQHSVAAYTWRTINGAMAFFLGFCAVVQHNDPDPILWTVSKNSCIGELS